MKTISKIILFVFFTAAAYSGQNDLAARIKDNISQYFQNKFSASEDELKISYKRFPKVNFNSQHDIDAAVYSQRQRIEPGYQTIWVELLRAGKLLKKYPVSLEVIIRREIWAAKSRIKFHQKITEDMLVKEIRYIKDNYANIILSKEDISGKEANRAIQAGSIFTSDLLRSAPVVHRGQKIKINVSAGSLLLSAEGIAKADGKIGDMINVRCLTTGKLLKARVQKPGIVTM